MNDDDPAAARPRPRPRPAPVPTAHDEPAHDEPAHDEPAHDEPAHDEPAHDEPAHDEPEPSEPGPGAGESVDAVPEPSDPEPAAAEPVEGTTRPSRLHTALARAGRVAAVLLVAAGVTVFVVARHDHDDSTAQPAARTSSAPDPRARLDDPNAAQAFVSAASTEVVIVTESDYRRLDDALSAGLSVTTGAFQKRFRTALTGTAAAQRVANRTVMNVQVLATGIGTTSADGRTAQVLVFAQVNQTGTNVAAADRTLVTTLRLTMVKSGERYLISDLVQNANAGLPRGTAGLADAAEAARKKVVDTLTYTRADFTTDLARAKAGADGTLLASISKNGPATLSRMTKGKYDLSGSVTSVAAGQVTDDAVVLLVAATGARVSDTGARSLDVDGHYRVVAQRGASSWIVTSITPVGAS